MNYLNSYFSFITPQAKLRLSKKLQQLKERLKALSIEKAEAAGDDGGLTNWHDNFAFDEANRECRLVERQISEIQAILSQAQEAPAQEQSDVVAIGTSVKYSSNREPQPLITIGSITESYPDKGLISYQAPLSSLLMGLKAGQSRNGKLVEKLVEITVHEIYPPSFKYNSLQAELD